MILASLLQSLTFCQDIRLNAAGNYRVHVTMLLDRNLKFTAGGKKMNVNPH